MNLEKPPLSDTQQNILSSAIYLVDKLGFEKTSLNDIANEAGVARSTIYSYYLNRDDVFRFALLHCAYQFVEKVVVHVESTPAGAERVVGALLFCVKHLPLEPGLSLVVNDKFTSLVNQHTLTSEAGVNITETLMKHLLGHQDLGEKTLQQLAEMTLRTLFSLLNMESPHAQDDQALRSFIQAWLTPAIHHLLQK